MATTLSGPVPIPKPQSSPLHVLVTGASRGIGFEFVKQYAAAHEQNITFAAARNPSTATDLKDFAAQHSNVHILPLDVDSEESIHASVNEVEKVTDRLDVLINNAAVSGGAEANDPTTISSKLFSSVINTNVTGVLIVTQTYLPLLQRSNSAKVVNVSSNVGSNKVAVDIASFAVLAGYGVSKAALNYLTTAFSLSVPTVTFLAVHPGWVATDSGNKAGKAPTSVHDSVQALRYYIAEKSTANSGEYFDLNGDAIAY